jgi:DNA (cytosine-5)-methyltransferase 1
MNSGRDYRARAVDVAQPLMAGGPVGGNQGGDVVCFAANLSQQRPQAGGTYPTLMRATHAAVAIHSSVRRLTPTECERLQGFPDGYTAIPYRGKPADQCSDGPRYKALGNSMAVPVMRWIGERIQKVEEKTKRGTT